MSGLFVRRLVIFSRKLYSSETVLEYMSQPPSAGSSAVTLEASLYQKALGAAEWQNAIATGLVDVVWEVYFMFIESCLLIPCQETAGRRKLLLFVQSFKCELQIDSDYRRESLGGAPGERMSTWKGFIALHFSRISMDCVG